MAVEAVARGGGGGGLGAVYGGDGCGRGKWRTVGQGVVCIAVCAELVERRRVGRDGEGGGVECAREGGEDGGDGDEGKRDCVEDATYADVAGQVQKKWSRLWGGGNALVRACWRR